MRNGKWRCTDTLDRSFSPSLALSLSATRDRRRWLWPSMMMNAEERKERHHIQCCLQIDALIGTRTNRPRLILYLYVTREIELTRWMDGRSNLIWSRHCCTNIDSSFSISSSLIASRRVAIKMGGVRLFRRLKEIDFNRYPLTCLRCMRKHCEKGNENLFIIAYSNSLSRLNSIFRLFLLHSGSN